MAESGGDPAPSAIYTNTAFSSQCFQASPCRGWAKVWLLTVWVPILAGCGVQGPPRPPRVQVPQQIKDLRAAQVGRTFQITFTVPVLAIDGERLTKPVTIDIFRAISPAGQKPASPDTSAAPWLSVPPKELPRYTHEGKVDVPFQITPADFPRQLGSTFSFVVIAFTRGFRGHPRKSAPSNVVQATLVDVTEPVTNLTVKASQTALLLAWDKPSETLTGHAPSHLSGYRVYQSATGKPGSFQLVGKSASTRYEDKSFQFGRQYYFRVSTVTAVSGSSAESEPSRAVGITPRDVFPPPVPTGLTAVNAAGAIDLLWTAVSASDLAGYNVYRSTDGGPFERINKKLVPTPIFHDASVEPGHHYQYAVTSLDLSGNESRKSAAANIATPSAGAH